MILRPAAVALAWAAAASSLALCVAALMLLAQASAVPAAERVNLQRTAALPLSILTFAAVGAFIVTRRPRNPVGWLFCGIGLAGELQAAALSYTQYALFPARASLAALAPIAWLINLWVVVFGLVPLLLLLFPDGRVLWPRWQPLVWLIPANMVIGFVTVGLDLGPVTSQVPLLENLFGAETGGSLVQVGRNIHELTMVAAFVAGAACLALRLRRARGDERAQLKWFAYASLVLACVLVALDFVYVSPQRQAMDPDAPAPPGLFFGIPFGLALAGVPVSAGIAIVKYRLYDIDLLINRTLVYGILTAGLGLLYWGSVIVLQQVLRPFTQGSELAIVGSTLGIAALFQPARTGIQAAVDRRFYRRKYDAARTLAAFSATLRTEVDLNSLTCELLGVVRQTLQPDRASLWLRPHPGRAPAGDRRARDSVTRTVTIPERSTATKDSG